MRNYRRWNLKSNRRKNIISYIIVAIISGIIGGIIAIYIAPNYLYGNILPIPEIYKSNIIREESEEKNLDNREKDYKEDNLIITDIAKKNMSSVVGITTVVVQKEWLWEQPQEGLGSGVIIDSDGHILTNSHVIGDGNAESINVLFENGDTIEGSVLWNDGLLDLAIIKANVNNVESAQLGNSDDLEVGELAVAIGNPLGLDFQRSLTSGVISGLNRSIMIDDAIIEDLIQTDASINPGNSGGPLLNSKGDVIGINTARIKSGEGLGFAIPINIVKPIIKEVVEEGSFNNVYIGFEGIELDIYERQEGVSLDIENGVVVMKVIPDSPAEIVGLKYGDIITKIDEQNIETMNSLRKLLYQYKIGDKSILKVNRDGEELEIEIEFNEF